jgi:hypothetical protein
MKTYQEMTLRELKDELISLHELIYKVGCYGASDLRQYDSLIIELDRRGYEVVEGTPKVTKQ